MQTIGEKIREARLQRGLTQADLGEDLVTASMISQIEADKTKPSYPLMTGIANRLGLPTDHFMNDLDEQFEFTAYIRLAEYYLLSQQPKRTIETLSYLASPNSPGLHRQEYLLLLARAHRQLGDYVQAVHHVEDLREQAFRLQDPRLMFSVLKESGYIEYGMGNAEGAMFEWIKAIELGESLSGQDDLSRVLYNGELTDLYFSMHRQHHRLGQADSARQYIEKAALICQNSGRFRDIADAYVNNAFQVLELADAGFAKSLLERAVCILDTARLVEQYILVHTKYSEASGSKPLDPWTQAAIATATADPSSFIEAELTRIGQSIDRGEGEAAERRIVRCFEIMDDYSREIPSISDWISGHKYHLFIFRARVVHLQGNLGAAISILEDVLQELQSPEYAKAQLEVCAYLILWYAESNKTERVYELSEHMESLMEKIQNRAFQLG